MKSGISLFDRGLAKSLLKRYWPLWAAYFLLLLIMLPVSLFSSTAHGSTGFWLNETVLSSAVNMMYVSFAAAALSALAVFGFMYNSRSCGLICSMPVRRETVFLTASAVGLLPLLLSDLLVFGVSALLLTGDGTVEMRYLLQWLSVVLMSGVAFFGIAALCAMLTGSVLMMPVLYAVLNVAVYVAEGAVRALLNVYIYGFCYDRAGFTWLSPVAQLGTCMNVNYTYTEEARAAQTGPTGVELTGTEWLVVYCIVGIILLGLALLLYRKRRMETAGDVVAVGILKPVFKYCMAFGGAVVFACVINEWVLQDALHGLTAASIAALLMLLGAFIGYYASEMLMQKSLDVFRGNIKGFAAVCTVLLVVAAVCEFDVFGYERRVPQAEDVEYISLSFVDGDIREPENIQAVIAMHRQITEHKEQNESSKDRYYLPINYYLKDGSHFARFYELDSGDEAMDDPASDLMLWQTICNSPEVTGFRTSFRMPVNEDTVSICNIDYGKTDSDGVYTHNSVKLTTEQALELYYDCMLPDIADGQLAGFWAVQNSDYYNIKTDATIYIELVDRDNRQDESKDKYESLDFAVQVNSERCLSWLRENMGILPISMSQAEALYTG